MNSVDPLQPLVEKFASLNWPTRRFDVPGGPMLRVEYPSGRGTHPVYYDKDDVATLLEFPAEDYLFLGHYEAVGNKVNWRIEARLSSLSNAADRRWMRRLLATPGLTMDGKPFTIADRDPLDEWGTLPGAWELAVSSGPARIEISPASTEYMTVVYGAAAIRVDAPPTLKIDGIPADSHDDTLEILETVGRSFLLDLDLRYGIGAGLATGRVTVEPVVLPQTSAAPEFPRNRYPAEALSLYLYGRAATELPLLAFLAFYQVLEYFFPAFAEEEAFRHLRAALTDPRFDPREDRSLGRLLSIAQTGRSTTAEREQLRATARGCIDADALQEFFDSNRRYTEHFCGRKQAITGVSKILLGSTQTDIRDQVSDRIYAIRCRIVHTKQDGGDSGVDLLLPSSAEARSLGPDVALVRLLAQRALIVRSGELRV